MKYTLLIVLMAMGLSASSQTPPTRGNYALLVRSAEHLNAGLKTADQLLKGSLPYRSMEIVVCGKLVKELHEGTTLAGIVDQAAALHVQVSFCGMSLEKFDVDPKQLPMGVSVTPNGLVRIFELQQQGYQTIEL